jgi:hypothetical protein
MITSCLDKMKAADGVHRQLFTTMNHEILKNHATKTISLQGLS